VVGDRVEQALAVDTTQVPEGETVVCTQNGMFHLVCISNTPPLTCTLLGIQCSEGGTLSWRVVPLTITAEASECMSTATTCVLGTDTSGCAILAAVTDGSVSTILHLDPTTHTLSVTCSLPHPCDHPTSISGHSGVVDMVYKDRCVRCNTHTGSVCDTVISGNQTLSCMGPVFTLPDKSLHIAVYDYTCICLAPSVDSYACVGRCVHYTTVTDGCMSLHVTDLSQLEGMPHLRPAAQGVPLSTHGVLSSLAPHPTRYTITAPTRNGHVYIALSPSLDVIGVSSINLSGEVEESLTPPPDQPLLGPVDGCGVCVEGVVWACKCGQLCGINPITQHLKQVPLSLCSQPVSVSASSLMLDTPTGHKVYEPRWDGATTEMDPGTSRSVEDPDENAQPSMSFASDIRPCTINGVVEVDGAFYSIRLGVWIDMEADTPTSTPTVQRTAVSTLDTLQPYLQRGCLHGLDICGTQEMSIYLTDKLSGMLIRDCTLTHCSLQCMANSLVIGTKFKECDFHKADLTGTRLDRCRFDGCDLTDTNLTRTSLCDVRVSPGTHAEGMVMRDAALCKVQLRDLHLDKADMSGACVSSLDLTGSTTCGITLTGVDLSRCSGVTSDTLCKAADISGTCLSGMDMSGWDMTDVSLQGVVLAGREGAITRLSGVDLSDEDFTGTSFKGVDVSGCDISDCVLDNACFGGVIGLAATQLRAAAFLAGVSLAGLDLASWDLSGLDLGGSDLTGCTLTDTNLTGCNLSNAVLKGASGLTKTQLQSLKGKTLAGLDLRCVKDMAGVDLTGYDLSHANLSGCNLSKVNLSGANMTGTEVAGADFTDANLSGVIGVADLGSASWLQGINLTGVSLVDMVMRGCDLTGANLTGCDLSGADFTDAVLDKASMEDTVASRTKGLVIPPPADPILQVSDVEPVVFAEEARSQWNGVQVCSSRWCRIAVTIPSDRCAWSYEFGSPIRLHINTVDKTYSPKFQEMIHCRRRDGIVEIGTDGATVVRVPVKRGRVTLDVKAKCVGNRSAHLSIVN
ncbi:hypothetical protein KIPB_010161, partial [Kipferlia bialata]